MALAKARSLPLPRPHSHRSHLLKAAHGRRHVLTYHPPDLGLFAIICKIAALILTDALVSGVAERLNSLNPWQDLGGAALVLLAAVVGARYDGHPRAHRLAETVVGVLGRAASCSEGLRWSSSNSTRRIKAGAGPDQTPM